VGEHPHGVHAARLGPVADVAGGAGSIIDAAGKLLHGQRSRELGVTHSQRYEERIEKLKLLAKESGVISFVSGKLKS
jgi:hypothetical protein